jgi:hypothetical protein
MEDLIAYVTCQCGEHTPPRLPPLHESGEERASLSSVSASLCNIRSLFFTPGSFLSLFWTVFVDMWFGRPLSSTRWWSDIALLLAAQPLAVLSLFPNGRVPLTASNECLIVASILQHYCVWAHCFLCLLYTTALCNADVTKCCKARCQSVCINKATRRYIPECCYLRLCCCLWRCWPFYI